MVAARELLLTNGPAQILARLGRKPPHKKSCGILNASDGSGGRHHLLNAMRRNGPVLSISTAALMILMSAAPASGQNHATWRDYGGSADAGQYSSLDQINRSNVKQLQVAWRYSTGDHNKYFFNPMQVLA
jgi:hypothetical protein